MLGDLPGITAIFPHLTAILLLWLLALIVIKLINNNALRNAEDIGLSSESIRKSARIAYSAATTVAAVLVVVVVLFLTSPFERNYKDMDRITPAVVDNELVAPSPEEIEETNELAVTRESDKKRDEATRENTEAMQDAMRLFQDSAAQADDQRNQ